MQYVVGLLLLVALLILLFFAGFLGLIWMMLMTLTFALYAGKPKPYGRELRMFSLAATLGLTPQILFLIIYNGVYQGASPSWLIHALNLYEWRAIQVYEHLERISDIPGIGGS